LSENDIVSVYAANASLSFGIYGEEIEKIWVKDLQRV
jgi:hypothetical protein